MRAYVLCGGFGTRLQSVTQGGQKALVPVHGAPFLQGVLGQLAQAGISQVVLCAHYRADQMADQLDALAQASGLELRLVVETEPLGTGGALLNALGEQPADGRFLVLNADTYLDAPAYRLAVEAEGHAIVGVKVEERSRYGSLATDAAGHLYAIEEKGANGPGVINAGVYAFTATAFVDQTVRACSLERELLPTLLGRESIAVCQYQGRFIDIGTPESFARYSADFHRGAAQ
ncbi:sugar phosphate nucleotidyltransferase [Pseudomonas peradeniyensis]|uniref:Sugar phosphate nucleotidyltransferase n=1 Tax=Pseudomonas peradeniyensis TaxID=2745488 RepID=A0ABT2VDG0_9PSED|nr:sugar phosphate nucleotidyltransferase [Pseudomonas peradeniyensis]MCU7239305.1 sugar phosphate nucleotidyltransferase [Pseudomonas peradeniyensis]